MRRSFILAPVVVSLALFAACDTPSASHADIPVLADVSAQADAQVGLVDRTAALQGATDADVAAKGPALNLNTAPAAFRMTLDASRLSGADEGTGRSSTYDNVATGAFAATAAYGLTASILAPEALAIDLVADGHITRIGQNAWQAVRTVPIDGNDVTGTFTVAWVGVGWLAEMRLSSSDGSWNGQTWFTGYLAQGGGLGWWDIYDHGNLAGVVEWLGDGQGNAQLGIAAVAGDAAGSGLNWLFVDTGAARVDAVDGSTGEQSWVQVNPDASGEVRLPDYNGGAAACWATDRTDTPCD